MISFCIIISIPSHNRSKARVQYVLTGHATGSAHYILITVSFILWERKKEKKWEQKQTGNGKHSLAKAQLSSC